MTGDREERNRVLGFPVDRHPNARPASKPQQVAQPRQAAQPRQPQQAAQPQARPQDAEPHRVLGLPVDWLDGFTDDVLRPLLRRIRGNRRK